MKITFTKESTEVLEQIRARLLTLGAEKKPSHKNLLNYLVVEFLESATEAQMRSLRERLVSPDQILDELLKRAKALKKNPDPKALDAIQKGIARAERFAGLAITEGAAPRLGEPPEKGG